jgi:hypothetical protein
MGGNFIVTSLLQNAIDMFTPFNFDELINDDIPNGDFAIYGIGVGQMFLCIGM